MKPETSLPWDPEDTFQLDDPVNEEFIFHACNAYPRLVEFVKGAIWGSTEGGVALLKDLGEL